METKICQKCNNKFVLDQDDFSFYEKMKVPIPTWCSECRLIRRISCINSWYLFNRNCDHCGKETQTNLTKEVAPIMYYKKCYQQEVI